MGKAEKSNFAYMYGSTVATYPLVGLASFLLVTGAFIPGLLKLEITNNQDDLWVNKDGQLWAEKQFVDDTFGRFFRAEQVIFRPLAGGSGDMIQKNYLQEVFWFQEIAKRTVVAVDGQNYSINDLCWSALPNSSCTIQSPMGFWQNNYTRLMNDPDLHYTTQCLNSIDPSNTLACFDETGVPVQVKVVFGGLTKVYNTTTSSSTCTKTGLRQTLYSDGEELADSGAIDDCTPYIYNAQALVLTFLLNDTDSTNPISEQWEQQAIIDTANLWKSNSNTAFIQALLPDIPVPTRPLLLGMNYMVGSSIPDELKAESKQNSFIVVISYTLMLIYITLSLGNIPMKKGRPTWLIGISGIIIVAASAIVGYGGTAYLGVKSSMISLEVIPFLVLAIGVDNMFIIAQTVNRETDHKTSVRVGKAIEECAPSIIVACITEVVTFAVGITTNIPALKVFCMTAVFAILANFVLQMTAFVAILSYDIDRTFQFGELYTAEEDDDSKTNRITTCFKKTFTPFAMSRLTNLVVFLVAATLVVLSVPFFNKMKLGIDQQITVRTNGVLYNYFQELSQYFDSGPQGYIIMKNVLPANQNTTDFLNTCTDLLTQRGNLITPPIQNWLGDFNRYRTSYDSSCMPSDAFNVSQTLNEFLAIPMDSYCCQKTGICGQQYYQDVVPIPDDQEMVNSSRIMFLHSPVSTQEDFIRDYDETHQLIASLQNNLTSLLQNDPDYAGLPMPEIYAYSMFYIYFEQYTYIKGVAVQNLLISMVLLFGIVGAVFGVIIAVHLVLLILFTILSMITLIYVSNVVIGGWGIMINAVSVVNLVTAIGFAVEFSVHILLKYSRTEGSKSHRIRTALNTMGTSVFSGIFCTKILGISVLAFAPSALFRIYYFRMYIIMILLCGFYGLLFLPAYLWLVGGSVTPKLLGTKDEDGSLRIGNTSSLTGAPQSLQESEAYAKN